LDAPQPAESDFDPWDCDALLGELEQRSRAISSCERITLS
jgi:hypothetical protein